MKRLHALSKRNIINSGLAIALALVCITSTKALAADAASFDNGDRLVLSYYWKIEHSAKPVFVNLIHQLGTKEGKAILGSAAAILGLNPTLSSIVVANMPDPKLNAAATDNSGVLTGPPGMTICKAGPVGVLEMSHATWSTQIIRRNGQDGLGYYTSVGTSPGTTHRIMGGFYVEFVKPVDDWMNKFGCMKDGQSPWAKTDGYAQQQ